MTNPNAVAPEPESTETLAVNNCPYPPPRSAGAVSSGVSAGMAARKKHYYSKIEVGVASCGLLAGSWSELMKASSPTHAKAAAVIDAAPGGGDVDDEHARWMMKHPSALGKFEQIMNTAKGKQIVMFMDYDGTLSPIVDDPDSAFMSEQMRAAVRKVASHFPTAIVTGRCLDKVYEFVNLEELYYAGSHGMDIKGPAKNLKHTKAKAKNVLFQPASEYLLCIDEVYKKLLVKTESIPGVKVENNKFCVSVHFRRVDEKDWNTLGELVKSVMEGYPKLRLSSGRKVLEIRPTIKWDKGKALVFLLESLGFANCKDVVPVYIGDDRTDEDAFKVLSDRGQGFGILVSRFPKETNASYTLQEPSEVKDFLLKLVKWKQLSSKARWGV